MRGLRWLAVAAFVLGPACANEVCAQAIGGAEVAGTDTPAPHETAPPAPPATPAAAAAEERAAEDMAASGGGKGEPLATIVVTATRTATHLEDATTSVTVVDREEIERRHADTVFDLLRDVPGLDVVANGSRGTVTDVLIRGAETDQTLVLIDGVEVNSVTLGSFDFGVLTTDNVERIEVLRGAGGTLYGSQAVGGVVNIITREGSGRPGVSALGEGGNGSTAHGAVASSGQIGRLRYSLAGAYLDTQGFHAENDDYRNGTASARFDYDVGPEAVARLFFRYTNAEIGLINNNNFLTAPDPNARQSDEFVLLKGEWEQEIAPDLELRLAASYTRDEQDFDDPPDAAETSRTVSHIPSSIVTGEIQANHYWRGISIATIGVEYETRMADIQTAVLDPAFELRSQFDEQRRNVAGYFQEQVRLLDGALIAVGGVRVDGDEDFGTEVSPAGSLSYRLPIPPTVRLKVSYAEGFKAPTFNELFFPDFGNPDLQAETSREVDVGVVASTWDGRALLEVTGFDRDVDDLIEGTLQDDGSFRAENRGDAHVRGFEIAPRLVLTHEPELSVGSSYTRLFRVDTDPLLRRPKHRGAVNVNLAGRDLFRPATRYNVNLDVQVVGDRPDVNPAAGFAFDTNPAYARVDLAAAYTFLGVLAVGGPGAPGGDLTLFAKVQNLCDQQYDEVLGFSAPPINFLAGLRVAF